MLTLCAETGSEHKVTVSWLASNCIFQFMREEMDAFPCIAQISTFSVMKMAEWAREHLQCVLESPGFVYRCPLFLRNGVISGPRGSAPSYFGASLPFIAPWLSLQVHAECLWLSPSSPVERSKNVISAYFALGFGLWMEDSRGWW